jgi:hypothetical protein
MSIAVDYILSFKNHPELQKLDTDILEYINKQYISHDKKTKYIKKSHNQILKNPKLQNFKDNIDNKINLILNKLSENNIDNLLNDFINNVGNITYNEYNTVQKTFYHKMINEASYIPIYLKFLIKINAIYNKVQNYDLQFFINILETKFNYDYMQTNYDKHIFGFISVHNNEEKRINNMTIIKMCIKYNIILPKLLDSCNQILFNQSRHIVDIYYWFVSDNILTNEIIKNINKILSQEIQTRDKLLLESLMNNTTKNINNVIDNTKIEVIKDTLVLESFYILDEYLLLESLDDVIYFITKKCPDGLSKNKFIQCIIEYYFNNNSKVIELLKTLIQNNTLNQINLDNGIILYKKKYKVNDMKLSVFTNITNH